MYGFIHLFWTNWNKSNHAIISFSINTMFFYNNKEIPPKTWAHANGLSALQGAVAYSLADSSLIKAQHPCIPTQNHTKVVWKERYIQQICQQTMLVVKMTKKKPNARFTFAKFAKQKSLATNFSLKLVPPWSLKGIMSSSQACAQSQTTNCGEVSSEDCTQELGKRAIWNSALLWIIDIPYPRSPLYQKRKRYAPYISLVTCSLFFWFKTSLLFQMFQIPRWRLDLFPSVLFPFRQPASQKGDATRLGFPIPSGRQLATFAQQQKPFYFLVALGLLGMLQNPIKSLQQNTIEDGSNLNLTLL